jgi:GT2 family glycosyltransferase
VVAHGGAGAARNVGARTASAELLLFVDADVVLAPGALAALCQELERDPVLAGAVGRYTAQPARAGVVNLYHNAFTRYHHDLSPPEIDWFWGALGALRRQAFFAAGGFDERYQGASAEDMELGLALSQQGGRLRYCPAAEGAHARDFTLSSMLANDYKKAVLVVKLRLLGRLPRRAPRFLTLGNLLTAPLVLATFISLILALSSSLHLLIAGLLIAVLLVENEPYYQYLHQHLPRHTNAVILLHWLQMAVIMAGAGAGILGWALRRPVYGRPGWW